MISFIMNVISKIIKLGARASSPPIRACSSDKRAGSPRSQFSSFLVSLVLFCCPLAAADSCDRIISLAPSITELVYELGLDSNLVGVTRFCKYPAPAQKKLQVGGFLDPNYETILSLSPSIVLTLTEQQGVKEKLEMLGVKTATLNHKSVTGIRESFLSLGDLCGVRASAMMKLDQLKREEAEIINQHAVIDKVEKRVMLVVGRSGSGGVFLSGTDGYYSEILKILGAKNVIETATQSLPTVSSEGIIALDPDIIIEIVPPYDEIRPINYEKEWEKLHLVRAVRNNQVYIVSDDFASVPGPRYPMILRRFAEILYSK